MLPCGVIRFLAKLPFQIQGLALYGVIGEGTLDLIFDKKAGANFNISGQKTENRTVCYGTCFPACQERQS